MPSEKGRSAARAALLDIDGTLLDSNAAHAAAWSQALQHFGYQIPQANVRRWVGMGGDKILKLVDPTLSNDREPGAGIERLRGKIFQTQYLSTLKPTPGARSLLLRLKIVGIRRVIATSARRAELMPLLHTAGVADQIDEMTTSDDAAHSKPDADIVERALEKAGVAPQDAIYVGDTPYDVEGARRSGVAAIALRCGGWDDAALSGAAALYDDPADLLERFNTSPFG